MPAQVYGANPVWVKVAKRQALILSLEQQAAEELTMKKAVGSDITSGMVHYSPMMVNKATQEAAETQQLKQDWNLDEGEDLNFNIRNQY